MAFILLKRLKIILFFIINLIVTVIFLSLCPFILILYAILSIYRFLIFRIAKYLDPTLGKMVSAISNFFAAHDIYENSLVINVAIHFAGKLDRHHVIQRLKKIMEEHKNPDGSFIYPELTQRVVYRYGYTFWKNVENFQLEDHIKYLNESDPDAPVTLEEVRRIIAKFGKSPLDKNRSPWVFYVVRNFQNEKDPNVKSALILRLHHCMFDGQVVLNLLGKMADNGPFTLEGQQKMEELAESMAMAKSSWRITRILMKIFKPVLTLCFGMFYLIGQFMSYDRHEMMKRNRKDFKGVMRYHECDHIPLEELKRIKSHYGVGMSALLTTLCARSLKKFMEKRGYNTKKARMSFPLLVLNHPDKLRNVVAAGIISFNFQHDDRVKLLHAVQRKFNQYKYFYAIGLPEASMYIFKILGSLPYVFVPKPDETSLSMTLMNSCLPGPIETAYLCGIPAVDATISGSIAKALAVSTLSLSYRGRYKFAWFGDLSIFPAQEDIQKLGDGIMEELQCFQREMEQVAV